MEYRDDIAIRHLYAAYVLAADEGRSRDWAECFTPDGVFADPVWGTSQGRDALYEFVAGYHSKLKSENVQPRHFVSNINYDVTGDSGVGMCYLITYMTTGGATELKTIGGYRDTLAKVGGQWLFARRDVFVD